MNEQTSLDEVARLLSPEAAEALLDQPLWVQESSLKAARIFLAGLEAGDVDLNPVGFEAVLDGMMAVTITAHRKVFDLMTVIDNVRNEVGLP